jgi:hypothetical protein
MNAEHWEQAEEDVRAIGGESWSIGIGRYPDHIWTADVKLDLVLGGLDRSLRGGRAAHSGSRCVSKQQSGSATIPGR